MPPAEPRPTARQGPSFQGLSSRPRTPLSPSYEISSSSTTGGKPQRPTPQRHESYNSTGSRDRRSEKSRDHVPKEHPEPVAAERRMQVTESVVAAAIRLDLRMRELEEVADLFEDFKESRPSVEVFKGLCFYFVEEILHSYHAVRNSWADMDDLREHRQGTKDKTGIERDAESLVKLIEGWKHEQKKQREVAGADKDATTHTEGLKMEDEAEKTGLRQVKEFSELVKRETENWRRDARRDDTRRLKKMLWEGIAAAAAAATAAAPKH